MVLNPRIARQADAGELKPHVSAPEVAVGDAEMIAGRRAAAAAQHALVIHELAVVFGERAAKGLVAGIRLVVTARPLPESAAHLVESAARRAARRMIDPRLDECVGLSFAAAHARCLFPLEFARQAGALI